VDLSAEQLRRWFEDGYVVVPAFLAPAELRSAQENLSRYLPTWDEFSRTPERFETIRRSRATKWEFPFVGHALNNVTTSERVIDLVESVLGTSEVFLTQSIIWAKYARTHDYEQELHLDYQNNSLVFPRDDGPFRQIPMIIYYDDVTSESGPTYVVSRKHTEDLLLEVSHARERDRTTLSPLEKFNVPSLSRSDYAAIYKYEMPVLAPAGSLLLFSMRTFHRGSSMRGREGRRISHHVVYRTAGFEWMGWRAWPRQGADPEMREFVEQASPRQLEVIGFPRRGHPYWNEETLAGAAARYPSLDLRAFRDAIRAAPRDRAGVTATADS
jgi:hypothetical protein